MNESVLHGSDKIEGLGNRSDLEEEEGKQLKDERPPKGHQLELGSS